VILITVRPLTLLETSDALALPDSRSRARRRRAAGAATTSSRSLPAPRWRVPEQPQQIVLAFHNHHDTVGYLPNNTTPGRQGVVSWRVLILPFIEQSDLYKQFNSTKPGTAANKKLIAKMPKLYAPIRVKARSETFYRGFAGKGVAVRSRQPARA